MKKLLISLLTFLVIFTSILPNFSIAKAADTSTWYNQSFFGWYNKVYDTTNSSEIFGERYTAAQVQWVVWSLVSMPINFLGSTAQPIAQCFFGVLGNGGDLATCGTNALNFIQDIFNTMKISFGTAQGKSDQPPLAQIFDAKGRSLSGIGYVERLAEKFSPVTKVNAQTGYGYVALDALQKYWTGFRNMAYAIIVLVTIIFAFMIMFRVKLNPQTVVSVQSALPKIILALILATFSYAIAGFLVDLTYVVSGLFASLIVMAGFSTKIADVYSFIVPSAASVGLGNFVIFGYMIQYIIAFAIALVWSVIANVIGLSVYGVLASVLTIFIVVWLIVLMVWYTIKIPWVLIKNLISIYISIVIAPLQIVAGTVVPSFGFGQWLKKLISELLVFPVTGLIMYLAWATLRNSYIVNYHAIGQELGGSIPARLWAPPIVGSVGDMSGLLWLFVSFGLIAMLPNVVKYMKQFIMGEKFTNGSAMGTAVGLAGTGAGFAEARQLNRADKLSAMLTAERAKTAPSPAAIAALEQQIRRAQTGARVSQAVQSAAKYIPHS